jgi:methylenetetrahydromethanopterin dehydrogenase
MVKLGILKMGALGSAVLLEYLFDERADRQDIEVRVVTSGAKMGEDDAKIAEEMKNFNPDVCIVVSPNATLPGPAKAREALKANLRNVIVISDSPAKKIKDELKEKEFGYILVTADSMIGARREFLDPAEMALFNSDVIKVLSATGAYRAIQNEIDRVLEQIKSGNEPDLPNIVLNAERAVEASNFQNPYAKAKAMAAYFIAEKVADVDIKGCFMEKDPEKYIPLVASAHEMMRIAAKLADEAREIEKGNDSVFRTPHSKDGVTLRKTELLRKPE